MSFNNQLQSSSGGSQALMDFQLTRDSAKKADPAMGIKIAQYIQASVGATNAYYWQRNERYSLNRLSANGRINMSKFQDLLQLNAKFNYVNLNWQSIKLVNRIISGLVGRWMARTEKIVVTATDSLSMKDKQEGYLQAEFLMQNREMIENLQRKSGVQMASPDQFIPEDKNELDLWAAEFQRLPEEIANELTINEILAANGWFDVLKEKALHDSAETGFVGAYTWMDDQGVVHVDPVLPENALYSYSRYNDFRDTTWRGHIGSMKISEIRRKYGQEFGGKLSEEDLWQIAQLSKDYQLYDEIRWLNQWQNAALRPYDEWNVDIAFFEIKSLDVDGAFTFTETRQNKSTIIQNGWPTTSNGNPQKQLKDNQQFYEDRNWNIYRGVYILNANKMLEWGLKKNMIRPQDPKELGDCEFSYSFYQYQSYDMRNIAVPEKVEEPADMMIITRLKIQQVIAKMRPPGAAINEDALQAIDYGLGEKNKDVDYKKQFDQTGDIYYRGKDAEGNPIPVPIIELQNSGFLPQMQGLMETYNFHYQVLKDELGEDPNLILQATKPRVTSDNVQTSQQVGEYATDYMYDAYLYLMEDVAKKVACLIKPSVKFGAAAYRHILKESDVDRVFSTRAKMLPTEPEIAYLQAMLNQAIQASPEFTMFCDPFKVLRIAKEDVKLAEVYFRQCQKKMIRTQQQQAAQNAQLNAQAQQQSLQMKAKSDMDLLQAKAELDQKNQAELSKATKEQILLQGAVDWIKQGVIPPTQQATALIQEVFTNVALPLFAENQQNKRMITQAAQMHQQMDMQDQQQQMPPADQQQQPISQPTAQQAA